MNAVCLLLFDQIQPLFSPTTPRDVGRWDACQHDKGQWCKYFLKEMFRSSAPHSALAMFGGCRGRRQRSFEIRISTEAPSRACSSATFSHLTGVVYRYEYIWRCCFL